MLLCCFRIDQSVLPARGAQRLQHPDSGWNGQHKCCSNIARVPPHDARRHTFCSMGGNGGWKHHDDRPCIGHEWCATFLWCCCYGCGAPIASQVWWPVPCLQNMRGQFLLSCYCLLQLLVTAVQLYISCDCQLLIFCDCQLLIFSDSQLLIFYDYYSFPATAIYSFSVAVTCFLLLSVTVTHFLVLSVSVTHCLLLSFPVIVSYTFPVIVTYSFPGTVSCFLLSSQISWLCATLCFISAGCLLV